MTAYRSPEYLTGLVQELSSLPNETEWVEFKSNNTDPDMIGKRLSALANSAALNDKPNAYMVWGIEDESHAVVGTTFRPGSAKKGGQLLEIWLVQQLSPKINFHFHEVTVDHKVVVLLEISRATTQPVSFSGKEFIRVGSSTTTLKSVPDRERDLWRKFDQTPFEELVAAEHVDEDQVLRLLDYPAYFDLLEIPLPANRDGIIEAFREDRLIQLCPAGGWNITKLGAILFAKQLDKFDRLGRKAMRVVQYRGLGRTETIKEQVGAKGYASGFEGLIGYINGLLPSNEVIGQALRKTMPMFPELAVRELVVNALIHQDFSATGTGPMIEIFDNRIEITNPGEPLVNTQRFIDTPPRSRNEILASLMRRFRICEERGTGIDKVVTQVEVFQLPAPLFEVPEGSTRVVLFAHKDLNKMDRSEQVRAAYQHACLRYVLRDYLTNSSLRERFGIEDKNRATASRIIKMALEDGLIIPFDPGAAPKSMKYLPSWAS